MIYGYYPGCSLEGTSRPYDTSLRRVMADLGHELRELDDWNCCGATMYMSVRETVALALSARNLALAEKVAPTLLAPCSACYTTLLKTQRALRELPRLRRQVDEALDEAGLACHDGLKVRHPLDVIVNDVGVETVVRRARRRLDGLKVAPYYGCQIVRPGPAFDDPDWPTGMDELFTSLGAECVYFPERVRCCGGMLTTTDPAVGDGLTAALLESARDRGADLIATTCPLCQTNLEAHQAKGRGEPRPVPVLFFTQLLGLALGASLREVGLDRSLLPLGEKLVSLGNGHA
jgi:heterodisulfide reductase subunit B